MTTAKAIYELVNQLPEEQAELVWAFAQFVQQRTATSRHIPAGTLTGLRGIGRSSDQPPTDRELMEDYTNYLTQKYQ